SDIPSRRPRAEIAARGAGKIASRGPRSSRVPASGLSIAWAGSALLHPILIRFPLLPTGAGPVGSPIAGPGAVAIRIPVSVRIPVYVPIAVDIDVDITPTPVAVVPRSSPGHSPGEADSE